MRIYRMPRVPAEKTLRTYYHVCALYEGQPEVLFSTYERAEALFEVTEGTCRWEHKKIRIISAPDTLGQSHAIEFYRELVACSGIMLEVGE